jgi:hypothetical protein
MINKNTIEERRKEFAEELHAGSVFHDIQAREKERKEFEKRWFWELLQNAKDSIASDGKVNIRIVINEDEVSFSHSGEAFELDEILSLIIQGSSKIDDKDKTGRFGTGFMTTYLLSKKVEISGALSNQDGYFKFLLNRDTDDIKVFFQQQKQSNDEFISSIRNLSYIKDSEYQTKFVYKLTKSGYITSQKGLQSLNELIPFTQLFNNQIGSITVFNNTVTTTYKKNKLKEFPIEGSTVEEWELITTKNDDDPCITKAYLFKSDDFDVVLVTTVEDGVESLINLDKKYPKLFFIFPLIGTEDFGIPFIINSTSFDPKKERDGIYLNSNENNKGESIKNKEIIFDSLNTATNIFSLLIKIKNLSNVYELFNFTLSKEYSWLDNSWLSQLKKDYLSKLIDTKCIPSLEEYRKLADFHIPYSHKENNFKSIWNVVNKIKSYNTVKYLELNDWIRILKNFSELSDTDIYNLDIIIGSNSLIEYVEKKKNITNLCEDINVEFKLWLDDFYLLLRTDLDDFPLDNKIILNQEGLFRAAEDLYWDKSRDNELNDISIKLGLNFPHKLISNEINSFEITGVKNFEKASSVIEILNKLNSCSQEDYKNSNYQKANALFIKWLIAQNNLEIIKDLKIISLEKNTEESGVIIHNFPTGKHLLLTPKSFFKSSFPLFSDIIREKDCMHPVYDEFLNEDNYKWLDKNQFIHYSPLVTRNEKLDSKTIELLIVNPDDVSSLKDDEGSINQDIILTYSDFACLTTSEGHIYDRNGTTSSSLKIFRFLLNEATEKDELFVNKNINVRINDKDIFFNQSLWLKRAKYRQWVNVKLIDEESTNKFYKEAPSSKNLSELIINDPDFIKKIGGEKQILFLTRIGVGVSELIRNTLPSDEVRASWDKALTNMITSDVDPELIQEIFSDSGIQGEYQKRIEQRNLIRRNQDIGSLVEKLFTELVGDLISKGLKVNIKREPFGSDYILTEESSDLVNGNEEEIFKINDWLIELKATGKNYAAMSSLQAKTATEKKDNYGLIVIPLDGSIPDMEYIRNNAKVVCNIGYILSLIIKDFNDIETKKNNLLVEKNGVSVSIKDNDVRFLINANVWNSQDAISITDFVNSKFN